MSNLLSALKGLLVYKEPEPVEKFILKENENEASLGKQQDNQQQDDQQPGNQQQDNQQQPDDQQQGKERSGNQEDQQQDQKKKGSATGTKKLKRPDRGGGGDPPPISRTLRKNLDYIKERFNVPTSSDVMLREFNIIIAKKAIPAFMVYYDGMVDRNVVDTNILLPLMLLSNLEIQSDDARIDVFIRDHLLTHNQIKEAENYDQVLGEVNFGGCGIFVDGMNTAFTADVKGFEHRTVERPNTEMVIQGPQEGFTETIRVNTALIRKRLKDEQLIVEDHLVGERSKTPCSILYIKTLANDSLVAEVRRRLVSIKIDYVHDSGEIEQLIEDSTFVITPQVVSTERPDRVAAMLTEGRVAVIVHGSPFVLVMPTTAFELIHSPEDSYLRAPYANLLRSIRSVAILVALLLPGLYMAISYFHQEMIPTGLLLSLEAARERVPFPSIVEILIMEVSFELIREAGIRIPGTIGPTLGIIGALILGQAAVAANIVSPILIIIVAVTGLGSFAIPTYSYAYSFRILRFGYILLGSVAGFLGIGLGLFLQGMFLVSSKSFGVPFFAPFAPRTEGGLGDALLREPIWTQERRPDYLNPKDGIRQPKISRGWTSQNKGGDDQNGK
jgi:spore germination protein KA